MPRAPKKCGSPACQAKVVGVVYCPAHTAAWETSQRGSTRASRTRRAAVLARDPICRCPGCRACTTSGCQRPSTEDDHVIPVFMGGTDAPGNHAGKCSSCHKVKSQLEAALARGARPRTR